MVVLLLPYSTVIGNNADFPETDTAAVEPMVGAVYSYRSSVFDDLQPLALCTTDTSDKPKPLIVDLVPGTFSHMAQAARECQTVCAIARTNGLTCVVLRPGGRGNGSLFQGYGEVDVYEAINAVRRRLAIDPDAITVTGVSMGGAGAWYHASHYPDFWAAAAPFCGYCDHKLWDKPGGYTFPLQEWEEFSWTSRDAAYRVPNLRNLDLRIVHGEWDRGVGGGVSVEHSRQMDRKLTRLGIPHTYIELPQTGHGARATEQWQQTIPWLLRQRRTIDPDQISLVVHTLRHNRAHWIEVEQQIRYGVSSTVAARIDRPDKLVRVDTTNVRRIAIGPLHGLDTVTINIDDVDFPGTNAAHAVRFTRDAANRWSRADRPIPVEQKQPGVSGPFGDLFIGPTVVVWGASGSAAAAHFNQMMAENTAENFRRNNGGLHRGGINGDNEVSLPVVSDKQFLAIASPLSGTHTSPASAASGPASMPASLPESPSSGGIATGKIQVNADLLDRANLLLIGDPASNAALARIADRLPIRIASGEIDLGGLAFRGESLAFIAVFAHPEGNRYVAVLAGVQPDAITWASHLSLQLLPDYLIFDRARVVDWGFWDNDWRAGKR